MRIALVLSGTGVQRFAAIAGVFKAIEKHHIEVTKLVATSGGALVGGLYMSGMSNDRICDIIRNTDYTKYGKISFFRFLRSFWTAAMNDGKVLEKDIHKWTEGKCLSDIPGLHITATDLTCGELRILNGQTEPTMTVAKAIRASLSIPIIWNAVEWRDSLLYDGGLMYNFPLDFFAPTPEIKIVGVRIAPTFCPLGKKKSFRAVAGAAAENAINSADRKHIQDSHRDARWLDIDHGGLDPGISSNEFTMSMDSKTEWINHGFRLMDAFIKDNLL